MIIKKCGHRHWKNKCSLIKMIVRKLTHRHQTILEIKKISLKNLLIKNISKFIYYRSIRYEVIKQKN